MDIEQDPSHQPYDVGEEELCPLPQREWRSFSWRNHGFSIMYVLCLVFCRVPAGPGPGLRMSKVTL